MALEQTEPPSVCLSVCCAFALGAPTHTFLVVSPCRREVLTMWQLGTQRILLHTQIQLPEHGAAISPLVQRSRQGSPAFPPSHGFALLAAEEELLHKSHTTLAFCFTCLSLDVEPLSPPSPGKMMGPAGAARLMLIH